MKFPNNEELNGKSFRKLLFELCLDDSVPLDIIVRPILKECYLNKINFVKNSIDIELILDGLEEKAKELQRVSWVLDDKHFKLHLYERDVEFTKNIIINGS